MFNRLPGAMLTERHMHECRLGHNCGRALLHHTAAVAESHRLFNPAPPEVWLTADRALLHDTGAVAESHRLFHPAPPGAGLIADG